MSVRELNQSRNETKVDKHIGILMANNHDTYIVLYVAT